MVVRVRVDQDGKIVCFLSSDGLKLNLAQMALRRNLTVCDCVSSDGSKVRPRLPLVLTHVCM